MKTYFKHATLTAMCFFLLSAYSYAQTASVNPNAEKDIQVLKNFFEAMDNDDYQKVNSLIHDDYMGFGPRYNSPENKADVIENLKAIRQGNEGGERGNERYISITINNDVNESVNGNWVLYWGWITLKNRETGKDFTIDVHQASKIQDGKVMSSVVYYNEYDALKQVGLIN